MPDDLKPLTPFPTIPTDSVGSAVEPKVESKAEPMVEQAQSLLDSAITEVVPDEKPVEVEKTVLTTPTLTEHPISDTDAKKFAGMGDFSLPESPLADLSDVFGATKESEKKVAEVTTEDTVEEKIPVPPVEVAAVKPAIAEKIDLAPSQPAAPSATLAPDDLEKKAEGMLKELNTAGGSSPKKRMSGSTVKMALAAVLVVLMGAGGIVGMNLLKMQQAAENRSKAGANLPAACPSNAVTCPTDDYSRTWYAAPGCANCNASTKAGCCGNDVNPGYLRCNCCDVDGTTDWTVGEDPDGCGGTNGLCHSRGFADQVGGGACPKTTTECYCESWANGCGVNCHFPSGTQGEVDSKAKANCKPYIAMCDVDTGKVSIEAYLSSHKCYNKVDECKNPFNEGKCDQTGYSCTSLTKDVAAPVMGSQLTFTCTKGGTDTINHYEFRYKIGSGAFTTLAAGTGNKSSKLTIAAKGDYTVECRVCKSTDATDCTAWGAAGK